MRPVYGRFRTRPTPTAIKSQAAVLNQESIPFRHSHRHAMWKTGNAQPRAPCGFDSPLHTIAEASTGFPRAPVQSVGIRLPSAFPPTAFPILLISTTRFSKTGPHLNPARTKHFRIISTFPASSTVSTVFFFLLLGSFSPHPSHSPRQRRAPRVPRYAPTRPLSSQVRLALDSRVGSLFSTAWDVRW